MASKPAARISIGIRLSIGVRTHNDPLVAKPFPDQATSLLAA